MKSSLYLLLLLLATLDITFLFSSVVARKSSVTKHNKHKKHKHYCPTPTSPSTMSYTTFNVLSFGAKGDGATDDSKVVVNSTVLIE